MQGRHITTLADGLMAAGNASKSASTAAAYATGLYFCRLQTDRETRVQNSCC